MDGPWPPPAASTSRTQSSAPGPYFNPVTEILLVVDDSAAIDRELFADADVEAAEWGCSSPTRSPVDDTVRDESIERFETRYHGGASGAISADHDDEDEVDTLEPDPEEDEGPAGRSVS